MSHETTTDANTESESEKVTPFPPLFRRRSTDKLSNSLIDDIKSTKNAFDEGFNPAKHRESMRGWVAISIVIVYGLCILLDVGFSIAEIMIQAGSLKEATEGFSAIGNMLSSHVVPIITLVLGFYFGSEKK